MKVSDYIVDFLQKKGIDTAFIVSGGAAAHLLNSLRESKINYICNAHEQACAMAAEGYARLANKPALVMVTNGPGSSNTITGILGAYQDSIPMFVVSGQVPNSQSMTSLYGIANVRQIGVQECDIIKIVSSITKYSIKVTDHLKIREILEEAYYCCMSGRKGPVWIDVPIDIQNKQINPDELSPYIPPTTLNKEYSFDNIIDIIKTSKKPLIVTGNGIHLSQTEEKFYTLLKILNIPAICSWTSKDLYNSNDKNYVGTYGVFGERAGNFAVQSADLLLILGSRLSIPNTGYQTNLFSPNSKKIMVDIDINELNKPSLKIEYPIHLDLNTFFDQFIEHCKKTEFPSWNEWIDKLNTWKTKYHAWKEPNQTASNRINTSEFIQALSSHLKDNSIVVTDMGSSFTCTMQSLSTTGKSRLFTSSACCSMGFGLPGAIGACVFNKNNNVICVAGDGGFQMNIQELQTVVYNKLPIKIFILNNNGYSAISLMQDNLFKGNYIGSNSKSGVSSPDFVNIGNAYKIKSFRYTNIKDLNLDFNTIMNYDGPMLIELMMIENQVLIPRVQSVKDANGNIKSNSLEYMFPYLSDEEMKTIL